MAGSGLLLGFVLLLGGLDLTMAAGSPRERTPVIIDTDVGSFTDDFWAMALLLADSSVDVRYIITSGGDTSAKAKILAKFLVNTGNSHIPIGVGPSSQETLWLEPDETGHLLPAEEPSDETVPNPILREWGAGFNLSAYPGGVYAHGIDKYRQVIEASARPVRITALGTLENVNHLLDMDERRSPAMPKNILQRYNTSIVSMGGTLTGTEEYNHMLDPDGYRRVFAASDEVLVVTADIAFESRLRLSEDGHYARLLQGHSRLALAMAQVELALANYGTHREVCAEMTDILFDSVAAFVVSGRNPELYKVEVGQYAVTNTGVLREVEEGSGAGFRLRIVAKWQCPEAATEFRNLLTTAIASGAAVSSSKTVRCPPRAHGHLLDAMPAHLSGEL